MALPRTIEGKEQAKFVESPTRPLQSAVEVVVGNPSDIVPGQNVDLDFADGDVSAIKAIYKTVNGVKPANNNSTEDEATVIGISINGAVDGDKIRYKTYGRMEDSSFNYTLNAPLYLELNGNLTETSPLSGYRTQVATSLGVGAININIQEPIML